MYFEVLGSVVVNNCVYGTRYCLYQFCHCLSWISAERLKCGLCVFFKHTLGKMQGLLLHFSIKNMLRTHFARTYFEEIDG